MSDAIAVENLRALNRSLKYAAGEGTTKAVGRANKKVGRRLIDSWIRPRPDASIIGTGAGAKLRPSAKKRELVVRAGGAHRAGNTPFMQWGRRPGRVPNRGRNRRPFIKKSITDNRERVFEMWIDAIAEEIGVPRVD